MKIVDANVLLYAVNESARHHPAAHRWLTSALTGTGTVGLPWLVLLAFLRVSTHQRLWQRPLTPVQAYGLVDTWCAAPPVVIPGPTDRHRSVLRGLVLEAGTAGNLTSDAHLAAVAVEYGATVATFDRDFERFGVEVEVPEA